LAERSAKFLPSLLFVIGLLLARPDSKTKTKIIFLVSSPLEFTTRTVEEFLALKSAKSVPSPKTGISLIPLSGTKGCVKGAQGRNGQLLIILLRAQLRPFKVKKGALKEFTV
jgi:hypothetical protein